ncbi:MAG: phosphate signaling complex protein PhoU [Spirochaetaceae bacterium]
MDQTRFNFSRSLQDMYQSILRMGALVEEALRKALTSVSTLDYKLAEQVIADDSRIDTTQMEVEEACTKLIATEQPVATNLREILVTIKIASDLERIGDHARHLARSLDTFAHDAFQELVPPMERMTQQGIGMLHDSLTAFVEQDPQKAREVAARDEEIDAMHRALYQKIVDVMKHQPDLIEDATRILFLNRFLERLGDHVTNVCEWIIYAKTSVHEELNE